MCVDLLKNALKRIQAFNCLFNKSRRGKNQVFILSFFYLRPELLGRKERKKIKTQIERIYPKINVVLIPTDVNPS